MRGITLVVLCALGRAAFAGPPSEEVAKRAAAAWTAAARGGNAAALARSSARSVRVDVDNGVGCPIETVAKTRAELARVARRLARCMFAPAVAQWHAHPPDGDTRTVSFATMDETVYMVDVIVDAGGRVTSVQLHTSYGGPEQAP